MKGVAIFFNMITCSPAVHQYLEQKYFLHLQDQGVSQQYILSKQLWTAKGRQSYSLKLQYRGTNSIL
jgi:hypothetical protein